ncbi:MAG: patatin-like phospholipase family protein, partial [Bacteroidota bacterium]
TSMGSIIGGLYAMGYPADTLAQLIQAQDWDKVLSDRIPLDEVIFEEKPFFENALIEFPFEGWRPRPPSGVIHGQQISKLLSRLTLPAYQIEHFHDLPIPFICVGADIWQGKAFSLETGDLAEAMRASMAIPTVFTPIRRDSFLFIDGGLLRNFPVQEAIDLGADIIIGSYTGRKLADKEEVGSFPSIMAQALFLLGIRDAEEQMEKVHIYIEPDLAEYGAEDFADADSILQRGIEAGDRHLSELKALADSVYQLRSRPVPLSCPRTTRYWVDTIIIENNRLIPKEQIRGKLGLHAPAPLDAEMIDAGLNRLYGTNFFERVHYRLVRLQHKTALVVSCEQKAATTLRFAINYDSYLKAGLLFNMTFRNSLFRDSRFIFSGKIAENYRFGVHYLKYLDKRQQYFVTASANVSNDILPIIQNGVRAEEFRIFDFVSRIQVQQRIGSNAIMGIAGEREQLSFRPRAGETPTFKSLNYTNLNLSVFFRLNTLNRNIFPTEGFQFDLSATRLTNFTFQVEDLRADLQIEADSLFGFEPYYNFKFVGEGWIPVSERGSIHLAPFLGIVVDPSNRFGDFFLVGSPDRLTRRSIPFHGLDPNELVAKIAVGGSIGYQHFISNRWVAASDISAGFFEAPFGLESNYTIERPRIVGGSFSIGYNSFLGPVKWTLMYPFITEGGVTPKLRSYISLGHRF